MRLDVPLCDSRCNVLGKLSVGTSGRANTGNPPSSDCTIDLPEVPLRYIPEAPESTV